jgi:hypothetical protein
MGKEHFKDDFLVSKTLCGTAVLSPPISKPCKRFRFTGRGGSTSDESKR